MFNGTLVSSFINRKKTLLSLVQSVFSSSYPDLTSHSERVRRLPPVQSVSLLEHVFVLSPFGSNTKPLLYWDFGSIDFYRLQIKSESSGRISPVDLSSSFLVPGRGVSVNPWVRSPRSTWWTLYTKHSTVTSFCFFRP